MNQLASAGWSLPCCGNCRHFDNAAVALEAAFAGLSSLGSAHADVRADDGLCNVHERYLAASSICAGHEGPAVTMAPAAAGL